MTQNDTSFSRTTLDVDQGLIALAAKYGVGMELRKFAALLRDLDDARRLVAAAELQDFVSRNEILNPELGDEIDRRIRALRDFTPADPLLWTVKKG